MVTTLIFAGWSLCLSSALDLLRVRGPISVLKVLRAGISFIPREMLTAC